MTRRWLIVLIAAYLAFDFAYPLTPGAVHFGDHGVDAIDADLSRSGLASAPAVLVPAVPGDLVVERPPARTTLRMVPPHGPRRSVVPRVHHRPSSDSSVLADEH